jgi:hypothetical protein
MSRATTDSMQSGPFAAAICRRGGCFAAAAALAASLLMQSIGCSGPAAMRDPLAVLENPAAPSSRLVAAMRQLDAEPPDAAYLASLRRLVASSSTPIEARKAAFERLLEHDRAALARQLELRLPREESELWRSWVCGRIAELAWVEMTPTLIRSWAVPRPAWMIDSAPRPERQALERIYGAERLPAVLLRELVESDPVVATNLRMRCWELLLSLDREATLRELLADGRIGPADPLLRDLRLVVSELGVLPRTREEILWARAICTPPLAAYRQEVGGAVATLPPARRQSLRMRDLALVAASARHRPDLLAAEESSLYDALAARLSSRQAGRYAADFEGYGGGSPEGLAARRRELRWSDLVAMHLALEAVDGLALRTHLFDLAERDRLDRTTEHGGVIALDEQGRFELLEFPPRSRIGDDRYVAPPELFEALRTGLFHFHLHAQQHENRRYAGPHLGDFAFADASGANCLVFTFIDSRTLNLDWYRDGRVVVDLGTIQRP